MRIRHPLLAPTVALLALVALAGCGDDGDDGASDGTGVRAAGGDVTVELTDNAFAPDTIEAAAGETYTVALENTGAVAHTFTADGVDEELEPGESATVNITVPGEEGQFEFFCRFHESSGMTGAFVTSGTPADDDTSPAGGGGY